ncbi:hypothetical protein [Flagellimonas sp.]
MNVGIQKIHTRHVQVEDYIPNIIGGKRRADSITALVMQEKEELSWPKNY